MNHPYFVDHSRAVEYYEFALEKERAAALVHVKRIKELEELVLFNKRQCLGLRPLDLSTSNSEEKNKTEVR